jgi:DNA-binding NarL/FixJ family response regulator
MYSVVETNWSSFIWMRLRTHKHVLIVDDSFMVRQSLKRYLSSRGDVVVCGEAVNGREAVQRAMALKPDLVLLDLAMPELNGAEVASVLKGAMPDTRIILFTMYRDSVGKYLSSAVGIDVVLSKPDGGTKLAAAIDSALAQISDSTY